MSIVRAPQGWDPTLYAVETFTGIAASTLTLENAPIAGLEQVTKNGLVLSNGSGLDYTVSGRTITLAVASVGTDDWTVRYWIRPNRGS